MTDTANTQPTTPFTTEDLIALVPPYSDDDLRQQTIVDLLEGQPATLTDAHDIIRRTRERSRWNNRQDRKRHSELTMEPAAEFVSLADALGEAQAALSDIFDAMNVVDAELLRLRFITHQSAKATADALGVSQPTMRRRVDSAMAEARVVAAEMDK